MMYRQTTAEELEEFVNKCKVQVKTFTFTEKEQQERIIELIIASPTIVDFQKETHTVTKDY